MWGRIRQNAVTYSSVSRGAVSGFDSRKLARQIPLHCGGVVRNRQPTLPQAGTHKVQQRCFCGIHEDGRQPNPIRGVTPGAAATP